MKTEIIQCLAGLDDHSFSLGCSKVMDSYNFILLIAKGINC